MQKLLIIFGLPGVGKTTIAQSLRDACGFHVISSEDVRSVVFNDQYVEEDKDFTDSEIVTVYRVMLDITKRLLKTGVSVVVEGVFRDKTDRERFSTLTTNLPIDMHLFYISCSEQEVINRLIERKKKKTSSPASVNTYRELSKKFEYPSHSENAVEVDGSDNLAAIIEHILAHL